MSPSFATVLAPAPSWSLLPSPSSNKNFFPSWTFFKICKSIDLAPFKCTIPVEVCASQVSAFCKQRHVTRPISGGIVPCLKPWANSTTVFFMYRTPFAAIDSSPRAKWKHVMAANTFRNTECSWAKGINTRTQGLPSPPIIDINEDVYFSKPAMIARLSSFNWSWAGICGDSAHSSMVKNSFGLSGAKLELGVTVSEIGSFSELPTSSAVSSHASSAKIKPGLAGLGACIDGSLKLVKLAINDEYRGRLKLAISLGVGDACDLNLIGCGESAAAFSKACNNSSRLGVPAAAGPMKFGEFGPIKLELFMMSEVAVKPGDVIRSSFAEFSGTSRVSCLFFKISATAEANSGFFPEDMSAFAMATSWDVFPVSEYVASSRAFCNTRGSTLARDALCLRSVVISAREAFTVVVSGIIVRAEACLLRGSSSVMNLFCADPGSEWSKDFHLKATVYPPQTKPLAVHFWHTGWVSSHFNLRCLQVIHPFADLDTICAVAGCDVDRLSLLESRKCEFFPVMVMESARSSVLTETPGDSMVLSFCVKSVLKWRDS